MGVNCWRATQNAPYAYVCRGKGRRDLKSASSSDDLHTEFPSSCTAWMKTTRMIRFRGVFENVDITHA